MAKTGTSDNDALVQEEILRVALRLYKKSGPGKVTMDDIGNATGRSRSSLYYYYKNHDEVFQAVMGKIANDVAMDIRNAVSEAATLEDKIYAFCIKKLKTSEEWKQVLNAMWSSLSANDKSGHMVAIGTLHKRLIYHESNIIREVLSASVAEGGIRAVTPADQDMLAFIISGGLRGIRNEIYEHNDPHDIKQAVRLLADVVIKWLKG